MRRAKCAIQIRDGLQLEIAPYMCEKGYNYKLRHTNMRRANATNCAIQV